MARLRVDACALDDVCIEAADEIERLRAENARLTKREAEASDLLDESVRLLERGDALLAQAMTGGARDA